MDFTNIAVVVSEDGSTTTLNVTKADGSAVAFVDPAGVALAVAAATPTGPVVSSLSDEGVTITHTDGTTQSFVPAPVQ